MKSQNFLGLKIVKIWLIFTENCTFVVCPKVSLLEYHNF